MGDEEKPTAIRAVENDALIESSFRRLLASIESEHEKIRGTWLQIEQERDTTTSELHRLRQETDEWCYREQQKIDNEWKQLNKLVDRMNNIWPEVTEVIEISVSGRVFVMARCTLCSIEESVLAHWFSDAYIENVPKDSEGRFMLDQNPECFGYVVEYLQNRRLDPKCATPIIPMEQFENMTYMAEALKLSPFLRMNKITSIHSTSLQVKDDTIIASHPGWQVISSQYPLHSSGVSYFEVHVLSNPDPHGCLALGVCGHMPQGNEIHSIRLTDSALYVSNNGILANCLDKKDVKIFEEENSPKIQLVKDTKFGIRYDANAKALSWYCDGNKLGTTKFVKECWQTMKQPFVVFAFFVPDQTIRVTFDIPAPGSEEVIPAP